eukprot:TRINITY_DN13882_c0_g1_i1.p1 TRINITY_DN13882_c0_g1~~TRINITY_DN13882_c0_g1_i1.p1  ORF type:complete len:156 (+),score=21.23 TRINITY_DN13882_c0_g1_i1:32-469(+)
MSGGPEEAEADAGADVDLKNFHYWAWHHTGADVQVFDASEEACKPFGFFHGQRVKHTKAAYKDTFSTVIGVKDGQLWYDPDGQDVGAVCTPAFNLKSKEDFEDAFGWEVYGTVYVEPAHPEAASPRGAKDGAFPPPSSPLANAQN